MNELQQTAHFPKKPGEVMSNGATIVLDLQYSEVEHENGHLHKSIVLAVSQESYCPFIIWDRWVTVTKVGGLIQDCVGGEYHRDLREAVESLYNRYDVSRRKAIVPIWWWKMHERGKEDGIDAASWLVDGNTNDPVGFLDRLIKGIEDGDPLIMDQLPHPRLGGEYADDPTWNDIYEDITDEVWQEDESEQSLIDAYEEGFSNGVDSEIHRMRQAYSS